MTRREPLKQIFTALALGSIMLNTAVASAESGKTLYEKHCAACHGVSGKGNGKAARALKPPPGPFATSPKAHSETDVAQVITAGAPHPSFVKKLSAAEIQAIAAYVKSIAGP